MIITTADIKVDWVKSQIYAGYVVSSPVEPFRVTFFIVAVPRFDRLGRMEDSSGLLVAFKIFGYLYFLNFWLHIFLARPLAYWKSGYIVINRCAYLCL